MIATGLLSDVAGPGARDATGSVLYVGATDLMSEANKEFGILNPLMVFLGIGMFFALLGVARLAGVEV